MGNQHLEQNCCDDKSEPLANVTFSNNVIDAANRSPAKNLPFYALGAIQMSTLRTDQNGIDNLMTASPHQDITIANNFIADAGRSAVWVGNTAGGSVSGNYFLHPGDQPDLADVNSTYTADATIPLVIDATSNGIVTSNNPIDQTSGRLFLTDTQYRDLAAYAPGGTIRLNAYNLGALASPVITLTDADGHTAPMSVQNVAAHAVDVQVPPAIALGGAFVTVTAGGAKYFGTLFVDNQDNVPAVNGCTYETSMSSTLVRSSATSVPMLVVTQTGCAYQVLATDGFVSPGGVATGTGVISVGFAANPGSRRSATIEIAGQPITLTQASTSDGGTFTDAALNGVSVKAIHVAELRPRIDALRTQKGLPVYPWTDPTLAQGSTAVRATHVRELRAALNEAYVAAARTVPVYTDAIAAGSTVVRDIHISELRCAVVALEQPSGP